MGTTVIPFQAVVVASLAGISLLAPPPGWSQGAGSATLRGTATDVSGGALAGASLTLTSLRTRTERTEPADASGSYIFVAVAPGPYRLLVAAKGFDPWQSSELHLSPGDRLNVDAILAPIRRHEEVTVRAQRELVWQDDGAREELITAEQIQNLSIISRGAMELLRILPGTVVPNQASMETVGFQDGGNAYASQSVNGMRGTTISPVLDGAKLTDIGNNSGVIVNMNPDMVEEVKVQSGNYAAEFGSTGVQVTAITKGGTAEVHGSVYDYWRSWRLAANDHSNNDAGLPRPENDYHYPGLNLSGPVLVPGTDFNKDRDKLFFFFGYEYQHQVIDPGTTRAVVPTLAQRSGNFSELLAGRGQSLGQPKVVTIPAGHPGAGEPAPNNDLSPYLDPIGQALLDMYPLPNYEDSDNRYNYAFNALRPLNRWQLMTRLDWNVSRATRAYARLALERETTKNARGAFDAISAFEMPSRVVSANRGWSVAANATSVLSPSMTNEVILSASRLRYTDGWENPARMSLDALRLSAYRGIFPSERPTSPSGVVSFGQNLGWFASLSGLPYDWSNDSLSFADNLSKGTGTHVLKLGVFVERADKIQPTYYWDRTLYLAAPWMAGGTGNDYGDLAVGRPYGFDQGTEPPAGEYRFWNYEAYVQDSWKASRSLTLEAGLRLSKMPNNEERTGLAVRFDPSAYDPTQGPFIDGDPQRPNGVLLASRGEIPNGITDSPGVKLMPRLSFAWDTRGNGDLILRGGAGLFYSRALGNHQYYVQNAAPNAFSAGLSWYEVPGGLTIDSLSTIDPWSRLGVNGVAALDPYSVHVPRTWNWSLAVAKRLLWSQMFELVYVGHRADYMPSRTTLNYVQPGSLTGTYGNADLDNPLHRAALDPSVVAGFRKFPAYATGSTWFRYEGHSRYHSLQATLSRSAGKRIQYFLNYTWSRVRGTTGDDYASIDPLQPDERSYGIAPQDRTHIFNASYNVLLPDPIGSSGNTFLRQVLDGWQISGITSYRSGAPFRLVLSGVIQSDPMALAWWGTDAHGQGDQVRAGSVAPVFLGDPRREGSAVGDKVLDVSQIGLPALGESGPFESPYYLRLPSRWNWDVTIFKNFALAGSRRLQLRIGFFNLLNQSAPWSLDDIDRTLATECNVRVDGVPNGVGGLANGICDPSRGFHLSDLTLENFGKILTRRGHRVIELTARFDF